MIDKMVQFIKLANQAQAICNSEVDWETKFSLIFSDGISTAIHETGIEFTYWDPDCTYEDDVRAFVRAVQEKANSLRPALQALLEVPGA